MKYEGKIYGKVAGKYIEVEDTEKQQLQAENARLRDVLSAAMENIRNADYAVALEKIKHALDQK